MGRHAHEDGTIIVCVTDSSESMDAVGVAAQLVSERGELVFLHVLGVPLEFALDAPPLPEEAAAQRRAKDLLSRYQAVAERYGVSSRRALERRHAAGPAIVEAAERCRAELVVLAGDDRFSRAGRLRLGATAAYVLRHAGCRVLLLSTGGAAASARPVSRVA